MKVGKPPSLTDLRGSGWLEQMPDAVIAVSRDQTGDNPDRSEWYVLKNRWERRTGFMEFIDYTEWIQGACFHSTLNGNPLIRRMHSDASKRPEMVPQL